jgi:hypothetical protein
MRWLSFNLGRTPFNRGNVLRDMNGRYSVGAEDPPSRQIRLRIDDIEWHRTSPVADGFGFEQIVDSNPSTYFAPLDADVSEKKPHFIEFRLKRPVKATAVTFTLYNVELYPLGMRIFVRPNDSSPWRQLRFQTVTRGAEFSLRFDSTVVRELRVECVAAAGQKRFIIAELGLERSGGPTQYPEIGFYLSDVFKIPTPSFRVGLTRHNVKANDIIVQYRCARSFDTVQSLPWVFDFLPSEDGKAVKALGRFCQFNVVYSDRSSSAAWSDLMITPLPN